MSFLILIPNLLLSVLCFRFIFVPCDLFLSDNSLALGAREAVETSRLGRQKKSRIVALMQSFITFVVGFFSLVGVLNSSVLNYVGGFIKAYFYYDYLQAKERHDLARENISDEEPSTGAAEALVHPKGVLFHHVVATMFLNGFLIMDHDIATLMFCLSELPVFLINVNWLLRFYGAHKTRQFKVVANLIILTYCGRILLFLLGFICYGLPKLSLTSLFNPWNYIALLCLLLIFALNLVWLAKLVYPGKKSKKILTLFQYGGIQALVAKVNDFCGEN